MATGDGTLEDPKPTMKPKEAEQFLLEKLIAKIDELRLEYRAYKKSRDGEVADLTTEKAELLKANERAIDEALKIFERRRCASCASWNREAISQHRGQSIARCFDNHEGLHPLFSVDNVIADVVTYMTAPTHGCPNWKERR